MSILYRANRPLVAFDVENADHRKWYSEFVKYNTWGKSPVRFMTDSLDQDLVSHVNAKMLSYYIKQEFENGKAKTKTRSKSKPQSAPRAVRGKHAVQTKGRKKQVAVSA